MSSTQTSAEFKRSVTKRMSERLRSFIKTARNNNLQCPKSSIPRKSYVRIISKTGKRVYVPTSCIPDVGNPGKRTQPGIGPLRKGTLGKYGYETVKKLDEMERRRALEKAVKALGSLTVWRKLNAIYVYTKHTDPVASSIYNADRNWIKATYGIKAS
jgi:hypothetical protein